MTAQLDTSTSLDDALRPNAPDRVLQPGSDEFNQMLESAENAAQFLKAISHSGRLLILCHLSTGEKSVTELEMLLQMRQSAVSQQLTRLRQEGLVTTRRDGKAIIYSLADERSQKMMALLYELFCDTAHS